MLLNRSGKKGGYIKKKKETKIESEAGVRSPGVCIKHGEWKTRSLVENTGSKWKTRGTICFRQNMNFPPSNEKT